MGEEVLGIMRADTKTFMGHREEQLFFTSDRVIVARLKGGFPAAWMFGAIGAAIEVGMARKAERKAEEHAKISPESVLKADRHNYAIPNSEIIEVKLENGGLHIITSKKKHVWAVLVDLKLGINQTHLTPPERKKYEELNEKLSQKLDKSEENRMIKELVQLNDETRNRILQLAFPDKLSIKHLGEGK